MKMFMYVSSWAEHGGAPGLGLYTFDDETGAIEFVKQLDAENSLNFSLIDSAKNRMYICNEIVHADRSPFMTGRIFVYDLKPETGDADLIAKIPTECVNPSYVSIDHSGKYFMIAHHSNTMTFYRHSTGADGKLQLTMEPLEADVQLWQLDEQGVPEILLDNVDHAAGIPDGAEAHPHSAVVSPDGKFIAVADKGMGTLSIYTIDEEAKKLKKVDTVLTDEEGAHPRYVVFHPSKPYLFVNHEAPVDQGKLIVTAFRIGDDGRLTKINTANALEPGHTKDPKRRLEQQGLDITPDGKYLYTVVNSMDFLAAFAIDQETGELKEIGNYPVRGIWPRGLKITPNGKFAISTCLVSGEITAWEIGPDGSLKEVAGGAVQKGASNLSFYQV